MSKDKPIEHLEIIEDWGGNSFNDSWLDLRDENANVNIVRNFGWMQRKINELVDFANGFVRKLSTEEEQLQHTKVLAEMARLLPQSVADQLRKIQEQNETQETQKKECSRGQKQKEEQKSNDRGILLSILERERIVLHDQCQVDWNPVSMTRLRSVERLIEAVQEKS